MAGPMNNAILSAFPRIPHLQELAIPNCLPEEDAPVYVYFFLVLFTAKPDIQERTPCHPHRRLAAQLAHFNLHTLHTESFRGLQGPTW